MGNDQREEIMKTTMANMKNEEKTEIWSGELADYEKGLKEWMFLI